MTVIIIIIASKRLVGVSFFAKNFTYVMGEYDAFLLPDRYNNVKFETSGEKIFYTSVL